MSNSTTIEAKTYTCHYIEKEDRLLLTINYQDIEDRIDFWLTRGFLFKLLPCFFDYVGVKKKQSLKIDQTTSPTDNSTFFLTQKKPVLLESIDLSLMKDRRIRLVLKNLEKNIFCVSVLEQETFEKFVELLTKTAPTFDWGINSII